MAKNKTPEQQVSQSRKKQTKPDMFGVLLARPLLVLAILVFVTYLRTLGFDYIGLDDDKIILRNLETLTQPSAIWKSLVSPYGFTEVNSLPNDAENTSGSPYYRPIVNLSFAVNALIGGENPLVYHLTNLILHAIAVYFVFLVLLKLFESRHLAFFLAAIFAVHPAMTNAVAWIAGRNDLLAGLFSILAFYYLLLYLDFKKTLHLLLHGLFVALAIFSKELALFAPFLFFGYLMQSGKWKEGMKKYWSLYTVWVLPIVLFTALRGLILGKVNVMYGLEPFLHNIRALPELLVKSIIPASYSPLALFSGAATLTGSLLLCLLILLPVFSSAVQKRQYYFGLLWFIVLVMPGLFILYPDQSEKFDYINCRAYLPSMGLLIAAAAALPAIFRDRLSKNPLLPLLIIGLSFGVTQYNQGYYKNAAVFADALQIFNPDSPFTYRKSADLYFAQGNFPKAIEYLDKALQTAPESLILRKNIALAYARVGDFNNSLKQLQIGLKKYPNDLELLSGLIKIQFMLGEYEQCFKSIENLHSTGKNVPSLYPLYVQLADKLQQIQPEKAAQLRKFIR